jgi:alpha-tubulin suppressor-like RCC1 family protein
VSVGYLHSCAVGADGALACWGAGTTDSACAIDQCGQAAPPSGTFSKVVAGFHHSCALSTDSTVQCWGERTEAVAPGGVFQDIFGGAFASCGLRSDDSLECWGPGGLLELPKPPAVAFSSVAISISWACGIRKDDGQLICWGENHAGELNAPTGSFRQVAVGDRHGCAIRDDDAVVCWGDDERGQSEPP